jgi:plastocyanin
MVHFARLLTAAALVSVSVAAPMKARTNDNNSYGQSGDSSSQPSADNSYQQSSDNSYGGGSGSYQQGSSGDNSYQQGGSSYDNSGSGSYQQGGSSYDNSGNSYQQGGSSYDNSGNSYNSDNSYQSTDSSYQSSTDNSYQSTDSSYQSSSDNSYQSTDSSYQYTTSADNSYQTSSDYQNNNYQTSSMMEESTMTTSSEYAYSTPSYGSGNQNWGNGYNDCVMQCAASYGMPSGMYYPPTQTASDSSMYGGQTGSNGVTHTIIVAPTEGVFRYMPFSTNASVGDTVEFYWSNGQHTVTSGSAVEVCTKNDQEGNFDSGKQTAGFQYSMVVQDEKPKWFFCGVADHCKQGMFGGININQPNPSGEYVPVSDVIANMSGNNDMVAMWRLTKSKTGDDSYANGWGMGINVAGMDDVAKSQTLMNVMWTQTLIAANPGSVDKEKGFQVTNQNLTIPADLATLLAASPNPSSPPSGSSNPPPAGSSSPSASESGAPPSGSVSAAKTNGAASVASSSIATVVVAVAAAFFML